MTKQFISRYMLKMNPALRAMPVVNAMMMGADIADLMNKTLPKSDFTSGRGGGRSALND